MVTLDSIRTLLGDHVHGVLDTAIRNLRDNRSVDNTEIANAVNLKTGIDNTLLDILGKTSSTARVEGCLGAIENSSLHGLIIIQRHIPGVFTFNDILETVSILEDIVGKSDAFANSDDIKIIAEVIKVDVGLLKRVGAVQGYFAALGDGANEINHDSHVTTLSGMGEVPLERTSEKGDEVKLKMRLAVGTEWIKIVIGGLRLAIFGRLFEVLVNSREPNHFKEGRAHSTSVAVRVGGKDLILEGTLAQDMAVHGELIFETEDEWNTRVVE
jgi:hypothetical protein